MDMGVWAFSWLLADWGLDKKGHIHCYTLGKHKSDPSNSFPWAFLCSRPTCTKPQSLSSQWGPTSSDLCKKPQIKTKFLVKALQPCAFLQPLPSSSWHSSRNTDTPRVAVTFLSRNIVPHSARVMCWESVHGLMGQVCGRLKPLQLIGPAASLYV